MKILLSNTIKFKFILIFLTIFNYSFSQSENKIPFIKWECVTKSKGIVFGIAPNIKIAHEIIDDFELRNLRSKYAIDSKNVKFFKDYYEPTSNFKPFFTFQMLAEKNYKVFSIEDVVCLKTLSEKGFEEASYTYKLLRNCTKEFAENRIITISRYINFLIPDTSRDPSKKIKNEKISISLRKL